MLATHDHHFPSTGEPVEGFVNTFRALGVQTAAAAADRVRQAMCGLSGHAMMMHFEADRLSLECINCGRRTPGWSLQPASVERL